MAQAIANPHAEDTSEASAAGEETPKLKRKEYEKELRKLQTELCSLQDWVKATGERIIVIFEGRDAAGKGGPIRALTERVSPRTFRLVALPAPSDREKSQIYMQRYVAHFPAAGEIVIFDRSWYNRAGVGCHRVAADPHLQRVRRGGRAERRDGRRGCTRWSVRSSPCRSGLRLPMSVRRSAVEERDRTRSAACSTSARRTSPQTGVAATCFIDLLARLREARPATDRVERLRESTATVRCHPYGWRSAMSSNVCELRKAAPTNAMAPTMSTCPADIGRLRSSTTRPAGWSVSRILGDDGKPSVGRVRVGVAMPRRYVMPGWPDESSPPSCSELEVDERRHADGPEGVDHEEAPGQGQALRDDREVRELRLHPAHHVLGNELARQHRRDREQQQRRDERAPVPRP